MEKSFKASAIGGFIIFLATQLLPGHRAIAYSSGPPTAHTGAPGLRITRSLGGSGRSSRVNFSVIELDALGEENALSFSVRFDPEGLQFAGAALAGGLPGVAFQLNLDQKAVGRVGVALALPAGHRLAKGNKEIVVMAFIAVSPLANSDPIEFVDSPISREVVDVNGNANAKPLSVMIYSDDPRFPPIFPES